MNKINVIAPIYNEQELIKEFVSRVTKSLNSITDDYKVILIDDGSKDNSWNIIETICDEDKKISGIQLSKNFGHHYAITAGIHNSDAEWTIVMDSDLQDRPEVIPDLYKKANEGYDIVFVSRVQRPESFLYQLLQKFFYLILRTLSGIKFDSRQANFSIINKKVVDAFKDFPEQARFYGSTINWLGFKRTYIEAIHGERFAGKPSYTIRKRLKLASDIILSFSDRPLKFAIYIGTVMASISFLMFIWIITGVIRGGFTVTGWASLISSIFLIGGVQITIIGIIGVYLSKVFGQVKNRPLFVIASRKNL